MASEFQTQPGRGGARIRILPDVLVDQIAAGEVVERPASVVKELVENALDAEATHISIEIEGGGKQRIRILDNGIGMEPEAAELSLKRHATSKIRSAEELFGLTTFGFRGEALPSIASVSRMRLTTRPRYPQEAHGFRLSIEGGTITAREEVGAPVGTCIEVADLLYNVPARQKFLKGEATEGQHIVDVVTKLALANPRVHFRLKQRGRTRLNAPGHLEMSERIEALFGTRLGEGAASGQGDYGGVRVQVFLGAPEHAQSTTRALQLFAARRPIRDRGLLGAVLQGYDESIDKGRYPVGVVFVDAPAGEVDVNVHPQKLEVRFSDPQLVFAAVRQVVRETVEGAGWLRSHLPSTTPASGASWRRAGQASPLAIRYAREHAKMMLPWAQKKRPDDDDATGAEVEQARQLEPTVPARSKRPAARPKEAVATTDVSSSASPRTAAKTAPVVPGYFSNLRYLGQFERTYLLCEAEGELVLLDQHAAYKRVEFSALRERFRDQNISVQRRLFPECIEVESGNAALLESHIEMLASLGFELEPFGEGAGTKSFALKAAPASLGDSNPQEVVAALLRELGRVAATKDGAEPQDEARIDAVLATVAGFAARKEGESVSAGEVETLLRSLDDIDVNAAIPQTGPVLLRIGVGEIARRFTLA